MVDLTALSQTLTAGLQALKDPESNPIAALFVIAIGILILLIVILVAYVVLLSTESRAEAKGETPEPRVRERNPRRDGGGRIVGVVLVLVAVAGLAYGWEYSVSADACARCHYTDDAMDSHAEGTHADVACRRCHVGPGAGAAITVRIRGLKNAVTLLGGTPEDTDSTRVTNGACLSCHEDVTEGITVARSINMRHSDVLSAGMACVDCHNVEGHGTDVDRPKYPRMADCIICHDGEQAASSCETCHNEDVGVAVRRPQRPYAQRDIAREDCRGCHSQDTCIACHGLELPHSEQFEQGYHALKAFLEPQMCAKCHDIRVFCNACHRFQVSESGATSWKREHASRGNFVSWHSRVANQESCPCHDTGGTQFCNYCHGPQPER